LKEFRRRRRRSVRRGPTPSNSAGRFSDEVLDEREDSAVDLVANGADVVNAVAGRVGELPVEVALTGVDGAGVAAAHGDQDVGRSGELVGEGFGKLLERSTPTSAMACTTAGLTSLAGLLPAERTLIRPLACLDRRPGGHLAAAGIVNAHEKNLRYAGYKGSSRLGEGTEAVAGEAADKDVQEVLDLGTGELIEALGQVPLDGLDAEDASELLGQVLDVTSQLAASERVEMVGFQVVS